MFSLPPPNARAKTVSQSVPRPVLTYSLDETHSLRWDDTSMKHFHVPPVGVDLNHAYDQWIKRPEQRTRVDALLQCLDRPETVSSRAGDGPNIITWRGIITKLIITPYERRNDWMLNAMLVNGTIYIEEHATAAQLEARNNASEEQRKLIYHGYAFESFCTSSSPSDNPAGWGGDVNTNIQWRQVVETRLGTSKLLIGGEVDCIRDDRGPTRSFVELKATMSYRRGNPWDESKFNNKLLRFWAQSYLLGVPEILVGFRSKSGLLESTRMYRTSDIPALGRRTLPNNARNPCQNQSSWDSDVCLEFGACFLSHLRNVMTSSTTSDSSTVWRISYQKGDRGIHIRALEDPQDLEEVRDGEDRVGILPAAFYERITRA